MSRMSQTLSGLTRKPGAESSQRPSPRLPVQEGVRACINSENVVLSRESQLLRNGAGDSSNLNHGSRENRISGQSEKKQTGILLARWTCPPKIILNENWLVAAGEQSEEVTIQEQRERLIQAMLPHPSASPPSPSVSLDDLDEDDLDDDATTPIIPIEPIYSDSPSEEEAPSPTNEVSNSMASASEPDASEPSTGAEDPVPASTVLDADVGAAASVAFTALMRSYEQGNLIDTELLIRLLNDPMIIEVLKNSGLLLANSDSTQPSLNTPARVTTNLVNEGSSRLPAPMKSYEQGNLVDTELLMKVLNDPKMTELLKNAGPLANSDSTPPSLNTPSCVTTNPVKEGSNRLSPSVPPPHSSRPNVARESFPAPRPPASSTTIFARPPSTFPPKPISTDSVSLSVDVSSSLGMAPPPVKDINYLKSLVREHGVERPEVEGPRSVLKTSPSSSPYSLSIGEPRNQLRHPEGQGNKRPMASSKPCMYFNSPKGCRLGPKCHFRHELPQHQPHSGSVSGASGFKRIKLERHSENGYLGK